MWSLSIRFLAQSRSRRMEPVDPSPPNRLALESNSYVIRSGSNHVKLRSFNLPPVFFTVGCCTMIASSTSLGPCSIVPWSMLHRCDRAAQNCMCKSPCSCPCPVPMPSVTQIELVQLHDSSLPFPSTHRSRGNGQLNFVLFCDCH